MQFVILHQVGKYQKPQLRPRVHNISCNSISIKRIRMITDEVYLLIRTQVECHTMWSNKSFSMVNNFIRRAQLSLYQSASGVCRRNKTHTLPSDASSNLTGLSRTDAKKQNDEGSEGEAVGNQVKSSIGADCCKIKFGRAGTPGL